MRPCRWIAGRLYWGRLQDRSYLRRVGASTKHASRALPSIECHSRFGRGRGNGTGRRSTAVLCTSVVSWVEAGLRKAAIGSVGGGLGTEAALGIEPVTSSLAGASLPPLVLFRIAKKPNTRIATTAIPCRVRRLGVSQGTTKRCCIIEPPVSPWRRAGREFYSTVPNSLLEIGGCARDTYWDGRACLGVTHSSQASAERFQQSAEFLPLDQPAGGILIRGIRPSSCGGAACIAHDTEPGGSDREHDTVATVLIIGASRGIGLETVKAALEAGHSVRALARSARRIPVDHPRLEKM